MLSGLSVVGADADDEERCALALAMGCSVGGSESASWAPEGRWVMRFTDRATAERVADASGMAWLQGLGKVVLPWEVVDFAVAAHLGLIEEDESGRVVSWLAPVDDEDVPERHAMPLPEREWLGI